MPTNDLLKTLPHRPGVYLMRNRAGTIVYIGKAVDLRKRVANYFRPTGLEPKTRALMDEVQHIDYIAAASEREALVIEQRLIGRHQPLFNVMWKDGKTYPFVKISTHEDFPRIRLTRDRRRDGARYFGPYPNVSAVRGLLEGLWKRKLFPLRPCDYEFTEAQPLPYQKVRSCLYLHTGECPAPCLGRINRKDYGVLVDRAILFFEGKNAALRRGWETEMKQAAAEMKFEKAAVLRDHLAALAHVRQTVTFRAMREEDVQGRIQSSQALQELQRALELPRPPRWIECFDISHVQGVETVASLVVLRDGKPDKSQYRKFRVRTVKGIDDFASMEEVVGRRYRRVQAEGGPWPDLTLIDGGPGQLSAALRAVAPLGRRLALASLAKREEEIFLPDRKDPIRLPKSSPALHLLQRVRDEAHRFAITFHRSRRDKKMIQGDDDAPAEKNS
ncbi:MAG TPA: excinuclease ABC subunit UvrC [Elusimicrobiota bacterium]|nr:excinuclease ABC subunit UvrC [Elusimicrobiota bacterium]